MAQHKVPPTERIVSTFKQLAVVSNECDAAADELGETISSLESPLKRLGLKVSAWHKIAGDEDENGNYWTRAVGWAKVGDRWGIAIRRTWGNERYDDHHEESWLFKDAPRWMCIESAGKLPDLFDDLVKRTEETTSKLKARTTEAREYAAAIEAILPDAIPAPVSKARK